MGKEHQELPGFYFDSEKKRYFPLKGAIPGTRALKVKAPAVDVSHSKQGKGSDRKLGNLLAARELNGNFVAVPSRNLTSQLLNVYMSSPRICIYRGTQMAADSCLKHISLPTQTPTGVRHLPFLLTASSTGALSVFQIGSNHDPSTISTPDYVYPEIEDEMRDVLSIPLCHTESWQLSSRISCLKLPRHYGNCLPSTNSHALITTMGSEACGGTLCTLNSDASLDNLPSNTIRQITTFDGTCWTAEFNRDARQALIGTNRGAALVDLETGVKSWPLLCKSDIFCQQLDLSGNVIMCGLRNGAIVMVDIRQQFRRHVIPFDKCRTKTFSSKKNGYLKNQYFEVQGKVNSSATVVMPSSVCSLVTLMSDDRYFLASSMNGSIALYDNRMTSTCPVQTYDGHVNSHSMLQLGVDEYERFFISGGEDKYLRLWNIKSGELLLKKKFWNSAPMTISWETSHNCVSTDTNYVTWFGSRDGIYRMQWR